MNIVNANGFKDVNITVKGLVQGIGYRPFVARTAEELGIVGWVKNSSGIVTIRAIGNEKKIKEFVKAIEAGPEGSNVTGVVVTENAAFDEVYENFEIIVSDESDMEEMPMIPSDLSICDKCVSEIRDNNNRRFRHPFNSCTACGPRYSIIEKLPYDRGNITMKGFSLCPICSKEYIEKDNRRRHAQTIACKECGPRLFFAEAVNGSIENYSDDLDENCIKKGIDIIRRGGVLAIKDIGGYHLACDPNNKNAVKLLRNMKHRKTKPLAVMTSDVASIRDYCEVSTVEEKLLTSTVKPIVLLRKSRDIFSPNVCANSPYLGIMLPCNALQVMLLDELGPLVMTSANASGDMMIIDDELMMAWMCEATKGIEVECGILGNDRPILTPLDDSIYQVVGGRKQLIRRGRGLVPDAIGLKKSDINILALGGDLKATFAISKGDSAIPCQNMGDLDEEMTKEIFLKEVDRLSGLTGFIPEVIVSDYHPGYISGKIAETFVGKQEKVYHHHAHVAAVMAEHNLSGRVLGVALDGTGYGEDGTVWGSEFLICEGEGFERIGHLRTVKLQGGDLGAKNTANIAAAYLWNYGIRDGYDILSEVLNANQINVLETGLNMNINTVKSSSMGRLFDAVSALLGICYYNSYEGEAPTELQYLAETTEDAYSLHIDVIRENGELIGDCENLLKDIISAVKSGASKASIAKGFIIAVANYVAETIKCAIGGLENDVKKLPIALSGGVMLNRILLSKTLETLENMGCLVYINEQVPPSDGGISLGQIYVARERNGK